MSAVEAIEAEIEHRIRLEECKAHPAPLLDLVKCVDAKTGETFDFHLCDDGHPWYWQRAVLDGWLAHDRHVILKARQLGVTWLAAGLALWTLLYKPGTRVLIVSVNQEEAIKVVGRLWDMLQSLPKRYWNGATVLKPARGARPSQTIELQFPPSEDVPEGRISGVIALPSTTTAGHGETAALVILDEGAHQEYARETWRAVVPTMADGGRILVVSTANGISVDDEEGNFFHYLWKEAKDLGIQREFYGWKTHPGRTQEWYDSLPYPAAIRAEQYPDNPDEAFLLTGKPYFDVEALFWYRQNALVEPQFEGEFLQESGQGRFVKKPNGLISVYRPPQARKYALAADVATGRGKDFSSAFVIDLTSMELCAEIHGKLDADQFAQQLHFLGRWYGDAKLAVELTGVGEAVVTPLRNDTSGRPQYPNLYRHRQHTRIDKPGAKQFGFPMTMKTRPQVISQLETAIREKHLPGIPEGLLSECHTFVYAKTTPSPRAEEGANDDRVMAAAIVLELYRQFGTHENRWRPDTPEAQDALEAELTRKVRLDGKNFEKRYGREAA